ncbi:DnaD domain-containing protein [Pueribacillus sp. YX66]|uniref:DnaD domain-containing protein n=1 Tax=Pueribacillus sp. YX66 TaxID=3229242 RepID=UPI00358CF827
MISKGWIKLHRKLLNNPVFQDPYLLKLWMYCLLKASHKEHKQLVGKEIVTLQEGQFIWGRNEAANELNHGTRPKEQKSPSTWERYLKLLEELEMLNRKTNNKCTVITIVNWRVYQDYDDENEQQSEQQRFSSDASNHPDQHLKSEQQMNSHEQRNHEGNQENNFDNEQQMNSKRTTNEQRVNTNKNVKNVKNVKNYKDDDDNTRVNPFVFFESEGFGTLTETIADNLGDLIDTYGETLVIHAMREAVLYGARNLKYVSKILENPNSRKGGRNEKTFHQYRGRSSQPEREDSITGGQLGWINRKRNTV